MEYICSDTNVWIDFNIINKLSVPFSKSVNYLIAEDSLIYELLTPKDLAKQLTSLGLIQTRLSQEEFVMSKLYEEMYPRLSRFDCFALSIAKSRSIKLMTGDLDLRKAGLAEGVTVIGTIGILDLLFDLNDISISEYLECLRLLHEYSGSEIRLPKDELKARIDQYADD